MRRTYDLAGNVTKIDDLRPNVPAAESRSESYSYDDFYRLVAAEGSWGKVTWQWSPSGNLLSRTSNVAALNSPSTTYGTHINDGAGPHAAVKLGNRTLTYDALGRMKHDGVRSYTWNAVDQLQRVSQTDGASSESIFDASGARRIRIERDAAGKTKKTHFVSRWSEIREGKLVRFIVHGGQRIARLAPSTGQVKGATGAGVAPTAADEPPPASTMVPLFQRAAWPALARALAGGQLPLALLLLLQLAMALTLRLPLRACWARLSAAPVQLRRASAHWSSFRTFAMTLAALGFAVACASTDSEPRSVPPIEDGSVQLLSEADTLLINDPLGSLLAETSGSGAVQARFATYPFGKTRFSTSS
ncbi:MAG TPA: hypothetical protein PKA88_38040, partial [Polyangiaceae bacterium]|nr:hypothetical protein [Polyangiaceae bacterium]